MTTMDQYLDKGKWGCWARLKMSDDDPVWISVAQDGIVIKRSRMGLMGAVLYKSKDGYDAAKTLAALDAVTAYPDTAPGDITNVALRLLVNVVLHQDNCAQVACVISGAQDKAAAGTAPSDCTDEELKAMQFNLLLALRNLRIVALRIGPMIKAGTQDEISEHDSALFTLRLQQTLEATIVPYEIGFGTLYAYVLKETEEKDRPWLAYATATMMDSYEKDCKGALEYMAGQYGRPLTDEEENRLSGIVLVSRKEQWGDEVKNLVVREEDEYKSFEEK